MGRLSRQHCLVLVRFGHVANFGGYELIAMLFKCSADWVDRQEAFKELDELVDSRDRGLS